MDIFPATVERIKAAYPLPAGDICRFLPTSDEAEANGDRFELAGPEVAQEEVHPADQCFPGSPIIQETLRRADCVVL